MSARTSPVDRASYVLSGGAPGVLNNRHVLARRTLAAALDDPDLGGRIRDWRAAPCEHSRVRNQWRHDQTGEALVYEEACSPCLRDRLGAYLLDGAA